jgi:hypothetical protein
MGNFFSSLAASNIQTYYVEFNADDSLLVKGYPARALSLGKASRPLYFLVSFLYPELKLILCALEFQFQYYSLLFFFLRKTPAFFFKFKEKEHFSQYIPNMSSSMCWFALF